LSIPEGAVVRVSKSEEYGIRLVMSLALSGSQLTIRELAEREGLPDTTVAKVVGRLRRAGLVEAERGRDVPGKRGRCLRGPGLLK
jgi:DNA-binding IscR family transcriptional regulator